MSPGDSGASIDELLERAVRAINEGDRATATTLAGQVLSVDRGNPEAEDLLAAPARDGEIRRLTIMFADLVDSTALSTRVEPETYRTLVGRYRDEVRRSSTGTRAISARSRVTDCWRCSGTPGRTRTTCDVPSLRGWISPAP